ncbi:MAG: hypothetical protein PHU11_01020 [Dysgonamonadaceae bacterium]|nr:hypothetical protein [Sulfurovum sp.]MDD3494461.1 hypothetical protein [Dysgonamonadaceae bacterium]
MLIHQKKLLGVLFASFVILQGCVNEETSSNNKVANVQVVEELKNKNIYSSVSLGNDSLLMAGQNGMSLINIDSDISLSTKSTKNSSLGFKIPRFASHDQLVKSVSAKSTSSMDTNTTNKENPSNEIDEPKIYTMLTLDDGILIGGKFASVNGIPKDNLVKLNYDGSINESFQGNTFGAVYKIIKVGDNIFISGIFGGYNDSEAYSIVKIDNNGNANSTFLPFKEYTLAKINDMISYDDKIIVTGTFVKDASSADENSTSEELISITKSLFVLDQNGQILEEESNKFSDLKNEIFSIAKDDDRLYIAGDFEFTKNETIYNNLVAYTFDGIHDENFKIEKLNGMIFDVALLKDMIVFGGDFMSEESNTTSRSFYIVDKEGQTIQVNNIVSDADIYNIDVYNENIIVSGEGEFKINDQSFSNSIILNIN